MKARDDARCTPTSLSQDMSIITVIKYKSGDLSVSPAP